MCQECEIAAHLPSNRTCLEDSANAEVSLLSDVCLCTECGGRLFLVGKVGDEPRATARSRERLRDDTELEKVGMVAVEDLRFLILVEEAQGAHSLGAPVVRRGTVDPADKGPHPID